MGAISYADNENLRMPNPTGSRRLRSCKKKKNSTDPLPALQPYDLLSISLRQLNTTHNRISDRKSLLSFLWKEPHPNTSFNSFLMIKALRCAANLFFYVNCYPASQKKEHQKYSKMETHITRRDKHLPPAPHQRRPLRNLFLKKQPKRLVSVFYIHALYVPYQRRAGQ